MSTAAPILDRQPRTPATLRAVLTLIGALVAAGLVAAGSVTLLDLAARHTFTTRAAYTAVRSLVVNASGGDVRLTSAPAGTLLTVIEHVTEGLQDPSREAKLDGAGTLTLKDGCSLDIGPECDVSYEIAVPAGVGAVVQSGAGNVTASQLIMTTPLRLSSGAGDVTAVHVSAPQLQLDSGAGDVTASLTAPAQRLEASSGAGDVTLMVPNVTYNLHASSGAGTVSDSSVQTDPSAPRRIDASSGAGDVTIVPTRGG